MVYLDNAPKSGDVYYSVKITKGKISGFLELDKIIFVFEQRILKHLKKTKNKSTMFHEFFILKSKDIQEYCKDHGYKVEIIETLI